jgi:hypothetical protein
MGNSFEPHVWKAAKHKKGVFEGPTYGMKIFDGTFIS